MPPKCLWEKIPDDIESICAISFSRIPSIFESIMFLNFSEARSQRPLRVQWRLHGPLRGGGGGHSEEGGGGGGGSRVHTRILRAERIVRVMENYYAIFFISFFDKQISRGSHLKRICLPLPLLSFHRLINKIIFFKKTNILKIEYFFFFYCFEQQGVSQAATIGRGPILPPLLPLHHLRADRWRA